MDKTEQLIIRACKSLNSHKRLHSVYRRFYFNGDSDQANVALARILSRVCDSYLRIKASTMVSSLHPDNRWHFGAEADDDYWCSAVKFLTGQIRLAERAMFPGLTPPAMFRSKNTGG